MDDRSVRIPPPAQFSVLLIDDSLADQNIFLEAVRATGMSICVLAASDGRDALRILDECRHTNAYPSLILLDLNIPGMDGREILQFVKSKPSLRSIPVAVWSSSENPRDLVQLYESGANCYLQKPIDFNEYMAKVEAMLHFWLTVIIRAPAGDPSALSGGSYSHAPSAN